MCFKRIIVETGTMFPEGLDEEFLRKITNRFSMFITPFTTNLQMLQKARDYCKCNDSQDDLLERFQIVIGDYFYTLNAEGKLIKLIHYLGNPETIYLNYSIGLPGGFGLDKKDGITYFLHTKESRHVPHVHAEHQGKEISIEILTLKVKNSFKSPKKQKEAVEHVKSKREEYLRQYNMVTNGIHIPAEYIEGNE